jgi:uncharacterized protein (DUF2164 family)
MKSVKQWDVLWKDEKRKIYDEVIRYFEVERDEKIWFIQAEEFTDFFMEAVFSSIYNKWIEDAQKILWERFQDFQVDLDLLKNN